MILEHASIIFRVTLRFIIIFANYVSVIEALPSATSLQDFFLLVHLLGFNDVEEELVEEEVDMEAQWEMIIWYILLSWHITKLVHIMSKSQHSLLDCLLRVTWNFL